MPVPVIVPILAQVIPAAINTIKNLFGGRSPYIERLAQNAIPLASQSQLPTLAFIDGMLLVFQPDGSTENLGGGANAQTAGPMVGAAVERFGSVNMITTIEPLSYKVIEGGSGGIGSILSGASADGNTWMLWAGGAVLAYLVLRR